MTLYKFGRKQRMHTQLVGNTSGKEIFLVDEYNTKKRISTAIIAYNLIILTTMYFSFDLFKTKAGFFFILLGLLSLGYGYFNYKNQKNLKEKLY